jgi:hypothetical protein
VDRLDRTRTRPRLHHQRPSASAAHPRPARGNRVVLAFIISLLGTVAFWSSLSDSGGDSPPSNGVPAPPIFSHPSLAAVGAVDAACGLILSALQLRHLRSTGIRKGGWKVLARIGVYLPAAAIGLVVVAAGTTGM